MAVTASLVFAAPNRLRYLLTQDGAAGTTLSIASSGAATPDLLTDSVGGLLRQIIQLTTFPNGVWANTAAETNMVFLSDWGASVSTTEFARATAECKITPRTGTTAAGWLVAGAATFTLLITAQAAAGTAYLDVEVPNQIGA